jgi:hypothetical protein
LGFLDDRAGRGELGGAADRDRELGREDCGDGLGGLVERPGAAVEVERRDRLATPEGGHRQHSSDSDASRRGGDVRERLAVLVQVEAQ